MENKINQQLMNEQLLYDGKQMRIRNILGIILFFTIFGMIVTFIISFIDSIKILSTDYYFKYKDKELNNQKILWGILGLTLLGNIACLVFANKMILVAKTKIYGQPNDDFKTQDDNSFTEKTS